MPPINKKKAISKKEQRSQSSAPVMEQSAPVERRAAAKSPAVETSKVVPSWKMRASQERIDFVEKNFVPTMIEFLRTKMGVNLYDERAVKTSVLYDLMCNRVTAPIEIKVTPIAYDRDTKKFVAGPEITSYSSLRFIMPYDKNTFKPVDIDDKHVPFIATYPCHRYLQKITSDELLEGTAETPEMSVTKTEEKVPVFTREQVIALENMGIAEDRLYANSFNTLPMQVKKDILAGKPFEIDGAIRTDFGKTFNVCGVGQMVTMKDGSVKTMFTPNAPEERTADKVIDILHVGTMGNINLDFRQRDAMGRPVKDIYDMPQLNDAGYNIVKYGNALCPVTGRDYTKKLNKETKTYEASKEKLMYEVSSINGGLAITPMTKVMEFDENGKPKMKKDGKTQEFHWEIASPHLTREDAKGVTKEMVGGLRIQNEYVQFASDADRESYKRGFGGVVKDALWKEYTFKEVGGKKKREVKTVRYDAFVVSDNQCNGFPKAFSPKVSKEIIEMREQRKQEKQEKKAVRKQNFGFRH